MFGIFKKKPPSEPPKPPQQFPPVPDWRPSIVQPLDEVAERVGCYTDGKRDFALFSHGTFCILPNDLSQSEAISFALNALHGVFHAHPDMSPRPMSDGNILIQYKNDVGNVVLAHVAEEHWEEIEREHERALATDEVLITPLGNNTFDPFGMKALFGRCYMFLDAQSPHVSQVIRGVA